jgi:hypothetical protein
MSLALHLSSAAQLNHCRTVCASGPAYRKALLQYTAASRRGNSTKPISSGSWKRSRPSWCRHASRRAAGRLIPPAPRLRSPAPGRRAGIALRPARTASRISTAAAGTCTSGRRTRRRASAQARFRDRQPHTRARGPDVPPRVRHRSLAVRPRGRAPPAPEHRQHAGGQPPRAPAAPLAVASAQRRVLRCADGRNGAVFDAIGGGKRRQLRDGSRWRGREGAVPRCRRYHSFQANAKDQAPRALAPYPPLGRKYGAPSVACIRSLDQPSIWHNATCGFENGAATDLTHPPLAPSEVGVIDFHLRVDGGGMRKHPDQFGLLLYPTLSCLPLHHAHHNVLVLDVRAARITVGSSRVAQPAEETTLTLRPRALPAFLFRDPDGPHILPTLHESNGGVTTKHYQIDRIPSAAVERRIRPCHLPHTRREDTLTIRPPSEQVVRRLQGDDKGVICLGANSVSRRKAEIETAVWPLIANHFPPIVDLAITKHDKSLVMSLVQNAKGKLTREKGFRIKEAPMEAGPLNGQLEVQRSLCRRDEGRSEGRRPESEQSSSEKTKYFPQH